MTQDFWGKFFLVGVFALAALWYLSRGKNLPSDPNQDGE